MKAFTSIFLAFQVLLSSMSFNLGMHFCGGDLQSISLFGEATPCDHAVKKESNSCPFHSNMKEPNKKKGCCDDKELKIEGQEHETIVSTSSFDLSPDFEIDPIQFIGFVQSCSDEMVFFSKYLNYKPPLIRQNIPVLIQSFLI